MKPKQIIMKSFLIISIFSVVCGIIYPLTMTLFSQVLFSEQANGSLLYQENKVIGSKLIAQPIQEPAYFVGRPDNNGVSNLGSDTKLLDEQVVANIKWWNEFDSNTVGKEIPKDLIYGSGSGVDPHISLKAAYFQTERIAKERNVDQKVIKALIDDNKVETQLGFFGETYVNVLELNLLLDKVK